MAACEPGISVAKLAWCTSPDEALLRAVSPACAHDRPADGHPHLAGRRRHRHARRQQEQDRGATVELEMEKMAQQVYAPNRRRVTKVA